MNNRDFSDSIKLETIKSNLKKNGGKICCEVCGRSFASVDECHFDHIYPYSKGGKSTAENCQLLCESCNLKKHDKELADFVLEEKAKAFLNGAAFYSEQTKLEVEPKSQPSCGKWTKDEFDAAVVAFIEKKGSINKVDFSREYNHLPSVSCVRQFYGNLDNLKKAFGIEDLSYNWNRENIREALASFVAENGDIFQKDMKKENRLPSIPCVLRHYPELGSFIDVKSKLCGLSVPARWTTENAVEHGREFVKTHGKITQKDLKTKNHLPSTEVINKLFGSLAEYQRAVGAEVSSQNIFISRAEISEAVERYFDGKERVVGSQKEFFETFGISPSTIAKRYGTFSEFCKEEGIKVLASKKAKYSKREVDDIISKWVKDGNDIPPSAALAKLGLPSRDVILKYYENWKEPFYVYAKLYEEVGRQ